MPPKSGSELTLTIDLDLQTIADEELGGREVEFLLVPWVGACVHTPPPAANQIVHVDYPEGFEAFSLFTPIRLEGRLTHRPAEHDLFLVDGTRRVATSYAMERAVIGGTPGEVVTITLAQYKTKAKQLLVEATSSHQPQAVLTLVGYGEMTYSAADGLYIYQAKAGDPENTVTVISDLGGSATAPVDPK